MINGFEKETASLNEYERNTLLPQIVFLLQSAHHCKRYITNRRAVQWLKNRGHECTEARFRKVVSTIRLENIVSNVIATSKGYYVSDDAGEIAEYIVSLRKRAGAINAIADALAKQGNAVEARLF